MIRKTKPLRTYLFLTLLCCTSTSAFAINAPADPRGTEIGQSLVKWEWDRVPGAETYEVAVDGSSVAMTRDAQYFSFNLWAGDHSMTVRAKASDGSFSERTSTVKITVRDWFSASQLNRSFLVGQQSTNNYGATAPAPVEAARSSISLGRPSGVRGTVGDSGSVRWVWDAVSGASSYDVTIDGGYAGTTGDTSFASNGLWEGEHSMTVVAVSSQGDTSPRSETVKLWVNVRNTSQNVQVNPSPQPSVVKPVTAPPPPAGNPDAASIRSMIDPASYNYDEVYQKPGYDLVFSDEFNGTSLNSFRWNTGLRWDGEYNGERYEYRVVNGEEQLYVNIFSEDQEHVRDITPVHNPFEFNGNRLAIRAIKNPLKNNNGELSYGSLKQIAAQQSFLSGAITTHDKFSKKYGIFEARIKIPSHVGAFPAFWLFHENRAWEGTQRTEIDIMENLGHAPWYIYNSFHYFKNVSINNSGDANFIKPYPNGQIYTGTDYSQDYHIYAVKWEPGKVTWMIDGVKVSELEHNEVNFEELYVKLNLAIGGDWTNYPANSGGLGRSSGQHFPNQEDLNNFNNPALEIDYVRVYTPK